MAWTGTVTGVTPGIGTTSVTVSFNDGLGNTFPITMTFPAPIALADLQAQLAEIKPLIVPSLNQAVTLQSQVGRTF